MNKKNLASVIMVIVAYLVVVVAIIGISAVLAEKITAQLILSWIFILIPFAVTAGLHIMSLIDKREQIVQNATLITLAGIYLILAIIGTIILNLLKASVKVFVITEIIIWVIGILMIIAGFIAKLHIEE